MSTSKITSSSTTANSGTTTTTTTTTATATAVVAAAAATTVVPSPLSTTPKLKMPPLPLQGAMPSQQKLTQQQFKGSEFVGTPEFFSTVPFTEPDYNAYNRMCRQFMWSSTSRSASAPASASASASATPSQVSPGVSPTVRPHQPSIFSPSTTTTTTVTSAIGSAPGARPLQFHMPRIQTTAGRGACPQSPQPPILPPHYQAQQVPIGYERRSSLPTSRRPDLRPPGFGSPTGRYWVSHGVSPPVSPCIAPFDSFGHGSVAAGDRWADEIALRRTTLVTHEMAMAAAARSATSTASPTGSQLTSPHSPAALKSPIFAGSINVNAGIDENDESSSSSGGSSDEDDDDVLPFGMAASASSSSSKLSSENTKTKTSGKHQHQHQHQQHHQHHHSSSSNGLMSHPTGVKGFSLFEDQNSFEDALSQSALATHTVGLRSPIKQSQLQSPQQQQQQQHIMSPLQPRVQIKYSPITTHTFHIPVPNTSTIQQYQQTSTNGNGSATTTTSVSSPLQRKYSPLTYRRSPAHLPAGVAATSPNGFGASMSPTSSSSMTTAYISVPATSPSSAAATNITTVTTPGTSIIATTTTTATIQTPPRMVQTLPTSITGGGGGGGGMLYSNIIRGSPQHHAQPSSSSSSFSSSTITATAASSQRVSRDDYSNGGGGGGGGGDEDGDGSGTRMATASRQRAKQALKKMRSEQAAQTGRDDLRQLAAGLLRNEAAGGGERWALLLELADLAKRENDFELARSLYRKAIKQKPKKSLCWLEYAKMEDECGETRHCLALLKRGLASCPLCESMMIKAIKIEEKLQNVAGARALLALLKDQPLEKTWRVVLEGALLEARCGNATVARKAFQYLIRNVPWYGPIYQEAFRFEERYEEYARAIRIVEQGLKENPKYGPLWFSAIRIYEKVAPAKLAPTLALASDILLKDLKWKVFFEQAQIEARAGRLREARSAYARAAEHCPGNLVWKVWLGGARTELCAGNADTARELIAQALASVPAKMRPIVVLDQARLEEYSGCLAAARAVLDAAKISEKQEWKIFLERILLEIRIRDKATAYRQALESLHVHAGTGRLWALKIQLTDADSADASVERQKAVFKEALREVPKSGEVWCEGARIYIKRHKHAKARMCLEFAAQFTPQYGDSFIEYLRNEFIETGKFTDPCPLERQCINAEPNYGPLWLYCKKHPLDSPREVLRTAREMLRAGTLPTPTEQQKHDYERLSDVNAMYFSAPDLPDNERFKLVYGCDILKS